MRARHERRNRYSIRKFSVGVASVVVATFFCVGGGGQVVQAADGARPQGEKAKVDDKLQELIKEAQCELEKLNGEIAEVDKLPKLPDNDPDYEVQKKYFWESEKGTLDKKIETFKESLTGHTYTESTVKSFISDCIYYQNFAKIEAITRQVAEYRKKYPNNSEIKDIFDTEMKQTKNDNYGSLENDNLTKYFDKHFRLPFDQIKQIVEKLEKQNTPKESDNKKPGSQAGDAGKKAGEQAPQTPPAEKEQQSKPVLPNGTGSGDNKGAGQGDKGKKAGEQAPQTPPAEKEQQSKPVLPNGTGSGDNKGAGQGDKGKKAGEQAPQTPPAEKEQQSKPVLPNGTGSGDNKGAGQGGDTGSQKPGNPAGDAGKGNAGDNKGAGQGDKGKKAGEQAPQTPPAEKEQQSKPVLPNGTGSGDNKGAGQGDKGKPAGDAGKPSSKNQTFTGTAGGVKVTVLFDKSVNAEKVTIKEITEKDLIDRISHQAGGGSIRLFDLSLTKNGKETHVNEERTVRLALEGLGEDVQVYHVRPDGQLEPIPSRVEDGHVIFRINHFSLFAIKTTSKKSGQETPSNQATPGTQAKSTPKETTKDTASKKTLPNTGTADSTALLAAAASTAILGLGLAGRRRKED